MQCNTMPFGAAGAPSCFQRMMDRCLNGLSNLEVECYLDDLLLKASTFKDHLEILDKVLGRLEKTGLMVNPSKCHFLRKKVEYLGFVD